MKPLFAAIALLVASAGFAQAQPPERLKPRDGMIIVPGLPGNLDKGEPVYRTPGAPIACAASPVSDKPKTIHPCVPSGHSSTMREG